MNNALLVATQSGQVNLNVDQKTLDMCIKEVNNFTSTTFVNICNGQSSIVPTGTFDYFMFFGALAFFGTILFVLWKVILDR